MWTASRPQAMALAMGRRVVSSTHHQKRSDFLLWMKDRGEDTECFNADIGISRHGRALFAERAVCAGECIMKFSQDLVLVPEKLPQEIIADLPSSNEFSRLSLLIIAEKHKARRSSWAPYIECLPSFPEMHNTTFWEEEELSYLCCSPVYRETFRRRVCVSSEYETLRDILQSYPQVFGKQVSVDQFTLAYATVSSRAWGAGPHSDLTMIPFVDFANHDPAIRTIFEHDGIEKTTRVIADRDYETGDEVCISYGNHSNALLAVDFGFCVASNPFEAAEFWMEIPSDDPLREKKLEMLRSNNMNTLANPDGSESGQMPFAIEATQEEEELVSLAARAFARVISSDSAEDLKALEDEAALSRNLLAFSSRLDARKEAQAMGLLAISIEANVRDHLNAIQALDKTNPMLRLERLEMAKTLLDGELQLLQRALETLSS